MNNIMNQCVRGICVEQAVTGSLYCERHRIEAQKQKEEFEQRHKLYKEKVLAGDGYFPAEDNIICPYCGAEWAADCERDYYCSEGDYIETCDECEAEFIINTSVSITYSMSRKDGDGVE